MKNAFDGRGINTPPDLKEDIIDHDPTKLFCCGLPLPVTMTMSPDTTSSHMKVVRILRRIITNIPRQLYANALLHLPALYSTRVSRILEDAESTMPEVRKLFTSKLSASVSEEPYTGEAEKQKKQEERSLALVYFKSTWESFVDSVMREWKTLNVISVLLLSYVACSHSDEFYQLKFNYVQLAALSSRCCKLKGREMTLLHARLRFCR